MKPRHRIPPALIILAALIALTLSWFLPTTKAQGSVQVTAADPFAAEQGTINLNVKVTGKGFKSGAKAKWLVTGTTDTGGVTVNSTTFVSSSELNANITVSDTATIANFDIQVLNSDGRGGKGTELFAVTAKGAKACPAQSPAPILANCYSSNPGCLDTSFGTSGQVLTQPSGSTDSSVHALMIQGDGRLVAAGNTLNPSTGTGNDFFVARYKNDGSLDNTFGAPDPLNLSVRLGYNIVSFVSQDELDDAVLQPDGKVLVSGYTQISTSNGPVSVLAVARFNTDGTLDASFGSGGKVIGNTNSSGRAVALQSDGKIVLAGAPFFGLVRLNYDGSIDTSFGSGGFVSANPSTSTIGTGSTFAVAIQRIPAVTGEERIVMGGWAKLDTTTSSFADFALMRFRSDGTLDTTFGNGGRVNTDFYGFGDQIFDLALDSSNRIVATGFSYIGSDQCGSYVKDVGLARYLENGSLDSSFNGTGRQTADLIAGQDTGYSVALQSDGKIAVAAFAYSGDNSINDFGLVRFNQNGSRDSSFGPRGDGVVTTDFTNTQTHYNYPYSIAVQPDGRIVVAGVTDICSGSGKNACRGSVNKLALARYFP